jgi:DNA helicase II / ATP-dependent DNA helicase PcrA
MQSTVECTPSRFLEEIPSNLVEYHEPSKELDAKDALEYLAQMKKKFSVPGFTG